MVMSTQILDSASSLLSSVLVDRVRVYDTGSPVTDNFNTTVPLIDTGVESKALVQTTVVSDAAESLMESVFSIKVPQGFNLRPGQVVGVLAAVQEPTLSGRKFLVEKISENGSSLIRKALAKEFYTIQQQGKGSLNV